MNVHARTPDFTDHDHPADPYPGTRPAASFVHLDGAGYVLTPDAAVPSGWRLGTRTRALDLDEALRDMGAEPTSGRLPVLSYGSNANPSKITWLREQLGLRGPAVVLRAECRGIAAVWSAGVRRRDGQRPAVLAGMPEVAESHTVWLVTPEQRRVLDRCEGRGERYRLAWVHAPIELEDARRLSSVLAYTAHPDVIGRDMPPHVNRSPLLVGGRLVRCSDVRQDEALARTGTPAATDGLSTTEVHGEP